jgi:hypothetical protein
MDERLAQVLDGVLEAQQWVPDDRQGRGLACGPRVRWAALVCGDGHRGCQHKALICRVAG